MTKLTGYVIRKKNEGNDSYSSTNENGDWCFDSEILRADIYDMREDAVLAIKDGMELDGCDIMIIGLAYEVVLS